MDKPLAKKSLGQNFLIDKTVAQLMVKALDVQKEDAVIEIGSGTGVVTKPLAETCQQQKARLTAVEFDVDLMPILKSNIPENEYVKIVNANILNFLDDFKVAQNTNLKLVGSLPYNITSPLLHRLIKLEPMPETCVFLIQKEVGQKIFATAPDSNYLSVFVQTFYEPKILRIVDKSLFDPIPQVEGAVIKLEKKPAVMATSEISRYDKFLHHTFSHPRKMLNKIFSKEELEKYKLDGTNRAQNYGWQEYLSTFLLNKSRVKVKKGPEPFFVDCEPFNGPLRKTDRNSFVTHPLAELLI